MIVDTRRKGEDSAVRLNLFGYLRRLREGEEGKNWGTYAKFKVVALLVLCGYISDLATLLTLFRRSLWLTAAAEYLLEAV